MKKEIKRMVRKVPFAKCVYNAIRKILRDDKQLNSSLVYEQAIVRQGAKECLCNIFKENPFKKENWIYALPCELEKCGCNIDYRIPKFLSDDEAREYVSACKDWQKTQFGSLENYE